MFLIKRKPLGHYLGDDFFYCKYDMDANDVLWTSDKRKAMCYHGLNEAEKEADTIDFILMARWNTADYVCEVIEVDYKLDPVKTDTTSDDYDRAMRGI